MFHFILGSLIGFLERPLVETAACLAERVCELVTSAYFDKNVCWDIKTVEMLKCSSQIPKHSHKRGEFASKLSDSARARQGIEPWLRTRHWWSGARTCPCAHAFMRVRSHVLEFVPRMPERGRSPPVCKHCKSVAGTRRYAQSLEKRTWWKNRFFSGQGDETASDKQERHPQTPIISLYFHFFMSTRFQKAKRETSRVWGAPSACYFTRTVQSDRPGSRVPTLPCAPMMDQPR